MSSQPNSVSHEVSEYRALREITAGEPRHPTPPLLWTKTVAVVGGGGVADWASSCPTSEADRVGLLPWTFPKLKIRGAGQNLSGGNFPSGPFGICH